MPGNQPPWPAQGAPAAFPAPAPSRIPMFIAIGVAVAALAVAIASWFRPAPEPVEAAPTFTDAQVAEAKANVCAVYKLSANAIGVASNRPRGTDETSVLAVAAQIRIATLSGPQYVLNVLNKNTATPADLAQTVNEYVSSYQQLGLGLLADKGQADMDPAVLNAGDAANNKLQQECL